MSLIISDGSQKFGLILFKRDFACYDKISHHLYCTSAILIFPNAVLCEPEFRLVTKNVCRQKCMSNLSEVWGCMDNPIIL